MSPSVSRSAQRAAFRCAASAMVLSSLVGLTMDRARAQQPGRCELPSSERAGRTGCFVLANQHLGRLPNGPLFWHLYVFPTRAEAEAVKAPRSTVVEAHGKVWLYSLAPQEWHPASGARFAVVGPLPHAEGTSYTARYLEATIPQGERTPVHTHAGPEAWVVLAGAQCLETPEGITVARAGDSAIVRSGLPMMLSSVGTETRQTLALVLHDTARPWTTEMGGEGWTLAGRCPK